MQGFGFNILSNDLDVYEIYFVSTVAEGLGKNHETQTLFLSSSEPPRTSLIMGLIQVQINEIIFQAMKGLQFSTLDICMSFLLLTNGLDQGCKMSGLCGLYGQGARTRGGLLPPDRVPRTQLTKARQTKVTSSPSSCRTWQLCMNHLGFHSYCMIALKDFSRT